jgi:hypothetical protein
MGKSDEILFREYAKIVAGVNLEGPAALLGFFEHNQFTMRLGLESDLYDITAGWNINSDWKLKRQYNTIISTRCPYFAKDPLDFLARVRSSLAPGGYMFLDWGLGDHWRYPHYKVGWFRDGEHEEAYYPGNRLHSCFWTPEISKHPTVEQFWRAARVVGGYDEGDDIDAVVKREVPSLLTTTPGFRIVTQHLLSLWPQSPQLYIMQLLVAV